MAVSSFYPAPVAAASGQDGVVNSGALQPKCPVCVAFGNMPPGHAVEQCPQLKVLLLSVPLLICFASRPLFSLLNFFLK